MAGASRREFLKATGSAAAAASLIPAAASAQGSTTASAPGPATTRKPSATPPKGKWDAVVVGAGVFGAWTAWWLRQAGKSVLLLDAFGPAHARASSGGESRMTRAAYGKDAVYARMAWESLPHWKELSAVSGLPIFHPIGVLFFFPKVEAYVTDTIAAHKELGLPTQLLTSAQMRQRFPQFDFTGIEVGLYEPELGALMARRAVQMLVERFIAAGGTYQRGAVVPPTPGKGALTRLTLSDGGVVEGDQIIFACGPWLPKLFPDLLGNRIFPTRQEVFFFAPPAGGDAFGPGKLPGWADFNDGDIFYGFPDLEARGFKIAHDQHGPPIDPSTGDRMMSPEKLALVRAYMERRFPALKGAPLVEARVCQYENSANGDLLIDRHPDHPNVLLLGAGSGHGFKHGPAAGRVAADLVLGGTQVTERFSLATKASVQKRSVH